jgi:biopolymer transport protein ExbD
MKAQEHPISASSSQKIHFMAAEISKPEQGKGKTSHISKRLSTKVDLTPMVDLGFLLLSFFILTTTLSKPNEIQLLLPAGEISNTEVGATTALTIVPVGGEKFFYYHGELKNAIQTNAYGMINHNGIRNLIMQKQLALDANPKYSRNDLMLIVKPTNEANYKNIVAVLDEVLINRLRHYSFVDISTAETSWLKEQSILK